MTQLTENYQTTLTAWIKESKETAKKLEKDFKEDEANLEKIKLNVYDIFLKMFNLSLKKTESKDAFKSMYLKFHKTIPKNWHVARDKAREKESIDFYIEDLKIKTANKIESFFLSEWDTHEQS